MTARRIVAAALLVGAAAFADPPSAASAQAPGPVVCDPARGVAEITGPVSPDMAKTYEVFPFEVADGTTRVEIGYEWTPADGTTLDLGLWDADGYRSPDGFRGWGGSREGRLDRGMARAWVQADSAERAFTPGTVEPGTWYAELGFAEVAPAGATFRVEVRCTDDPVGPEPAPDPVDAEHVADPDPGWYRGDFHMHGRNSSPDAPDDAGFVEYARAADLDFLPVTEYVVTRHWNELGAVQRDNPDLLVWPGREVITYSGHAIVLGETPSTVEYRHGFEDVSLGGIQDDVLADGATFGIAHPTVFPEREFGSTCRGCEFQLSDSIDLDRVDTVEVVTDAVTFGDVPNPFVATALDFWHGLLRAGHRVTAVSGSDDKLGPELGSVATMVYADELSRTALQAGVRAGHAYVQARGAHDSPTLEMTATTPDGATAMMGDTVVGATAEVTVAVADGAGQRLRILRNGVEHEVVDVTSTPFTHTFVADRTADEGPLGTFWEVQTFDDRSLTTISNPIFLASRPRAAAPDETSPTTTAPPPSEAASGDADESDESGSTLVWVGAAVVAGAAIGSVGWRRARRGDRPA